MKVITEEQPYERKFGIERLLVPTTVAILDKYLVVDPDSEEVHSLSSFCCDQFTFMLNSTCLLTGSSCQWHLHCCLR